MGRVRISRRLLVVLLALGVTGAEGSSCTLTTDAKVDAEVVVIDRSPDAGTNVPDAGEEAGGGHGLGNAVQVTPSVVVVSPGDRVTFEALVTPPPTAAGEQLTNKIVIWSVKESLLGGTITQSSDTANGSPKGDFVAGQVPGTYTIRARSDFDPEAVGEATVIVKRVGVDVNPPRATLQPGDSLQFTASVKGAINTAVEWSIVEGAGAAGIVTDAGLYLASRTGTFHVKATSVEDRTVSGLAEVTVTVDELIDLEVCPSDVTLTPGEKLRFTASPTDVSWSLRPVTGQPTGGAILVDNEVTAGSVAGTFVVRATSTVDPSRYTDATVRVRTPAVPNITGRVIYNGAGTGRVMVTGEGGWAGTALAESDGSPWTFKIRGARDEAGKRTLRAWVDTLGTGTYVPGVSPTGLVELNAGPLSSEHVTIYLADPDALAPPPPASSVRPRVHPIPGKGALVCVEPVLEGEYEAATTYEVEVSDDTTFAVVRERLTTTPGGPRCVFVALPNGTRHTRSRARRGELTGGWSPTADFVVSGASTGAHPVTGKVFFAELPPDPGAVAYVALVPFAASQDIEPEPDEYWARLTGLTNPTSFELQGVGDGRYTLHWALDFDGDGRLVSGDYLSAAAGEVTVGGAAVGNVTIAVPRHGAVGRVMTHTATGGKSVTVDAQGFGATNWQNTLSLVPASFSSQPPVDLPRTPAPQMAKRFDVSPGLTGGDIIKLNTTTGYQTAPFSCTHQAVVTGVLEPVADLHVDAGAAGTSMVQPQIRWQPAITQPGAPSVERYEASLLGTDGRTLTRRTLSSSAAQFIWAPTETTLGPGHYEFRVVAVDTHGNTSATSISHSVLVPPTGLSIRPNELAALPTVAWDALPDNAGVLDHEIVFRRSGRVVNTVHAAPSAVSAKPSEILKPGNYEVTVSRRNLSGQAVTSATLSFGVISPPILDRETDRPVNSPVLYYSHSPVPVEATTLLLSLMGGDLAAPMKDEDNNPPPPDDPADIELGEGDDSEPLSPGTYVFTARAVDKNGRYAESTLTWDVFGGPEDLDRRTSPATRPILTWGPPAPSPAGLSSYEVYIERFEGSEGGDWIPVLKKEVGASRYSVAIGEDEELQFDPMEVPIYRWYVRAYDEAGSFSESGRKDLVVFGPPTEIVASVVNTYSLSVTAKAPFATEALKWEITLQFGGGSGPPPLAKSGMVVNGSISHLFENLPVGRHTYVIRVSTTDNKAWSEEDGEFCIWDCEPTP